MGVAYKLLLAWRRNAGWRIMETAQGIHGTQRVPWSAPSYLLVYYGKLT
jgi:hypothetical protein